MKSKDLIEKRLFKGYPQHELNYIDLRVKDIIGLMEEYANQQWISVKDSLPEYGKKVIVVSKNNEIFMIVWTKFDQHYYTHWMPLPEPPQE